ncbi:MAG: type II secretion system F family protein [Actinomycetaceae bacterium]|nr:type II secretion system F family protein [Actinomycetaceae bacterium]MDY6082496.1 type II secretion system F family protein [Actinomycetaceae bacterium]
MPVICVAVVCALLCAFAYTPYRNRPRPHARIVLPDIDPAMMVDLLVAALQGGASIPRALEALDDSLAYQAEPAGLRPVAQFLLMGADWDTAWEQVDQRLDGLKDALEPAWVDGAAPVPLLQRAAESYRASRSRRSREAAEKLGARLVLPLGVCFLPAFVAIGIVPVIVATGFSLFG